MNSGSLCLKCIFVYNCDWPCTVPFFLYSNQNLWLLLGISASVLASCPSIFEKQSILLKLNKIKCTENDSPNLLALLRDNSEWNIIFYFINLEMMKLEEENCPLLHSRPDFWNQHLTETLSSSRQPIIWHPSMSRMIFEVALKLMSSLPLSLRFWHPDTRLSIGKVNSNLKRRDFGSWEMKYILGQFFVLSTLQGTRKHIPPNGSKRAVRKIIDSKVPAGFGDLWSFPQKCSLFLKHVPYI